ncbi:MAG TPA: hypothetical protein VGP72_31710 [Planctomycetota bacterium]|jgi:hypothetical protein
MLRCDRCRRWENETRTPPANMPLRFNLVMAEVEGGEAEVWLCADCHDDFLSTLSPEQRRIELKRIVSAKRSGNVWIWIIGAAVILFLLLRH